MEKDLKDILLKDLCARLPYGVKVQTTYIMQSGERKDIGIDILTTVEISMLIEGAEEHKPYLFPLSSMTEEQKYICPIGVGNLETFIEKESWAYLELSFDSILRFIDWINKNHFDYRGLIPKGLAIDATGLNIY